MKQFESSPLFPTSAELNQCEQGNRKHNDTLFNRFIEWLTNAMDINIEFC